MKKILVIGSAVADVIINLEDKLPRTGEDVHVRTQQMRPGGCGFNTYHMIRHFSLPAIPFFPVGQGAYGDFIWRTFSESGISTPIPRPERDNGCCYCFIEPDGERTFISYHGAEYRFQREWFDLLAAEEIGSVYFCGLEIEEPTGPVIVDYLETLRAQENGDGISLFFAPGPRLTRMKPSLVERIFALSPILHLNGEESMLFTGMHTYEEAASCLFGKTHAPVLITLGSDGCYVETGNGHDLIPGVPAHQSDTNGAGDAHIGAVIASCFRGNPLTEAVRTANRISARVVEVSGALLSDGQFEEVMGSLP